MAVPGRRPLPKRPSSKRYALRIWSKVNAALIIGYEPDKGATKIPELLVVA